LPWNIFQFFLVNLSVYFLLSIKIYSLEIVKVCSLWRFSIHFCKFSFNIGWKRFFSTKIFTFWKMLQLQSLSYCLLKIRFHLMFKLQLQKGDFLLIFFIDLCLDLNFVIILFENGLKIISMFVPFIDIIFKRIFTIISKKLFHLSDLFALCKMFLFQILKLFFQLNSFTLNGFILIIDSLV